MINEIVSRFEHCFNCLVTQTSCTACREAPKDSEDLPTDSDLPCATQCHNTPEKSENLSIAPSSEPPPSVPPRKEGRNLKRVPSERFQKMRRKVQRLMSCRSSDATEAPSVPMDESTYLQSIRIPPNPGYCRNDRYVFDD